MGFWDQWDKNRHNTPTVEQFPNRETSLNEVPGEESSARDAPDSGTARSDSDDRVTMGGGTPRSDVGGVGIGFKQAGGDVDPSPSQTSTVDTLEGSTGGGMSATATPTDQQPETQNKAQKQKKQKKQKKAGPSTVEVGGVEVDQRMALAAGVVLAALVVGGSG